MFFSRHEGLEIWHKLKAKTLGQAKREATIIHGQKCDYLKIIIARQIKLLDGMKEKIMYLPLIQKKFGIWWRYKNRPDAYIASLQPAEKSADMETA